MIHAALCALAVAQTPLPKIVELPDPKSERISVQAIVAMPELGERELAAVRVLEEVLPQGTEEYSVNTLRTYSSLTGQRVRCLAMPDHFRIQLSVPKGQLPLAVSMMDSMLRRASLPQEGITAAVERQPFRFRSYWTEALHPFVPNYSRLTREEVVNLYRSTFWPERITIGVGGAIASGEAHRAFGERFSGWVAPRLRPLRLSKPARPLERRLAGVTTIELASPPVPGSDASLPAKMLGLMALGTGKGSSAFRIWRDANGWTYRTEAVLWPVVQGFQLRIVAAARPSKHDPEQMRNALLADIAAWGFETRERALGMAEAVLIHGIPYSPLYLSRDTPLTSSIEDRTFMAAFWQMKTGRAWDAQEILRTMQAVDTETLQKTAKELVEQAYTRVVTGTL